MTMLDVDFYKRPTLEVAKDLLGKVLVVMQKGKRLSGKIVETEAYIGSNDKACHASWRNREFCKSLWGPAGFAYVYLTYGLHYMLNIVTEKDSFPSAVLIRAVEPIDGVNIMVQNRSTENIKNLTSGPAKLTKAFGIDKGYDGRSITSNRFYISNENYKVKNLVSSSRIGIDYANEPWKSLPWRFCDADSSYLSRKIVQRR